MAVDLGRGDKSRQDGSTKTEEVHETLFPFQCFDVHEQGARRVRNFTDMDAFLHTAEQIL